MILGGRFEVCSHCGVKFFSNRGRRMVYKGKIIYFCCRKCRVNYFRS